MTPGVGSSEPGPELQAKESSELAKLHHETFPVVLPAGDPLFNAWDSVQSLSSKTPGIFLILILIK